MRLRTVLVTTCMFSAVMGVGMLPAIAQDTVEQKGLVPSSDAKETKAPDQPFEHPANDSSYSKDVPENEHAGKSEASDNGSVRYVSGGVGEGGMKAMDAQEKDYNLKLTFVAQGEYLADINVNMTDGKGNSVLVTKTEGPVLLVKTPPGHYTVVAQDAAGTTLKKYIKVGKTHLSTYVLRYPDITND